MGEDKKKKKRKEKSYERKALKLCSWLNGLRQTAARRTTKWLESSCDDVFIQRSSSGSRTRSNIIPVRHLLTQLDQHNGCLLTQGCHNFVTNPKRKRERWGNSGPWRDVLGFLSGICTCGTEWCHWLQRTGNALTNPRADQPNTSHHINKLRTHVTNRSWWNCFCFCFFFFIVFLFSSLSNLSLPHQLVSSYGNYSQSSDTSNWMWRLTWTVCVVAWLSPDSCSKRFRLLDAACSGAGRRFSTGRWSTGEAVDNEVSVVRFNRCCR